MILKSLVFASVLLFVDCTDPSNEPSSSSGSSYHQLIFTFTGASFRHPFWTLDGADYTVENFDYYYKKYNIRETLDECQLEPQNFYPYSQISECLAAALGKAFRMKCFTNKHSRDKEQYLEVVEVCFNRATIALEDCHYDGERLCDPDKLVLYATVPIEIFTG